MKCIDVIMYYNVQVCEFRYAWDNSASIMIIKCGLEYLATEVWQNT